MPKLLKLVSVKFGFLFVVSENGVRNAAIRTSTTHGKSKSPLYIRWRAMRARCQNKKSKHYRNYGGRGIFICERWSEFENFAADMGGSFIEEMELERKDNNGNYEPSNCIWVSRETQQRNRRSNHLVSIEGVSKTLVEWQEETGIKANTILTRIRRGWPEKRILEIANK